MNPKDQKPKEEKPPIATVQVQEVPEKKEVKEEEPVNFKLTVKERIDAIVDKVEDKIELKKQMFQLVQRILYPEQFCPQCDERMFFNPATSTYNCPNCGYQSKITTTTNAPRVPSVTPRMGGKVPDVVENAIKEANEAGKEPIVLPRPTALGEKIRKLVNDRDAGGPAAPTKEDEARVHNADKNTATKVNWV